MTVHVMPSVNNTQGCFGMKANQSGLPGLEGLRKALKVRLHAAICRVRFAVWCMQSNELEFDDDEWWRQQYFSYARIGIVQDKSRRVKSL